MSPVWLGALSVPVSILPALLSVQRGLGSQEPLLVPPPLPVGLPLSVSVGPAASLPPASVGQAPIAIAPGLPMGVMVPVLPFSPLPFAPFLLWGSCPLVVVPVPAVRPPVLAVTVLESAIASLPLPAAAVVGVVPAAAAWPTFPLRLAIFVGRAIPIPVSVPVAVVLVRVRWRLLRLMWRTVVLRLAHCRRLLSSVASDHATAPIRRVPRLDQQRAVVVRLHVGPQVERGGEAAAFLGLQLVVERLAARPQVVKPQLRGALLPHGHLQRALLLAAHSTESKVKSHQ